MKPTKKLPVFITEEEPFHTEDPQFGTPAIKSFMSLHFPRNIDYSQYLIINLEVQRVANITIRSQDLYVRYERRNTIRSVLNPTVINWENWYLGNESSDPPHIVEQGVRFVIEVKPKSGAPASIIYRTFTIN